MENSKKKRIKIKQASRNDEKNIKLLQKERKPCFKVTARIQKKLIQS